MTEAMMIKAVAIGGLAAAGLILNLLLAKFPTRILRQGTLAAAGLAAASLLLVVILNPARSGSPGLKAFGDAMGFATLGFLVLFLLGGFTLRARK